MWLFQWRKWGKERHQAKRSVTFFFLLSIKYLLNANLLRFLSNRQCLVVSHLSGILHDSHILLVVLYCQEDVCVHIQVVKNWRKEEAREEEPEVPAMALGFGRLIHGLELSTGFWAGLSCSQLHMETHLSTGFGAVKELLTLKYPHHCIVILA